MTSRATAGAEARDNLARALLTLAEDGHRPRCSDSPSMHLSESADEREQAARWCYGCPLLTECAEAGEFEKFGVWGGRDRSAVATSKAAS